MPNLLAVYVSYSQIAVFNAGLEQPFNDWSKEHVKQGFAWRPESVSFKMLKDSGKADVSWEVRSEVSLRPESLRAIQVPFAVPETGIIEISSITDGHQIQLPKGPYLLIFEAGMTENESMWCHFSFVHNQPGSALILKADRELDPPVVLLMEAVPA